MLTTNWWHSTVIGSLIGLMSLGLIHISILICTIHLHGNHAREKPILNKRKYFFFSYIFTEKISLYTQFKGDIQCLESFCLSVSTLCRILLIRSSCISYLHSCCSLYIYHVTHFQRQHFLLFVYI